MFAVIKQDTVNDESRDTIVELFDSLGPLWSTLPTPFRPFNFFLYFLFNDFKYTTPIIGFAQISINS